MENTANKLNTEELKIGRERKACWKAMLTNDTDQIYLGETKQN